MVKYREIEGGGKRKKREILSSDIGLAFSRPLRSPLRREMGSCNSKDSDSDSDANL